MSGLYSVVNLAIKVMKPVLRKKAVHVEVKACAEKEYARLVQAASLKKVWYTGCSSVSYLLQIC